MPSIIPQLTQKSQSDVHFLWLVTSLTELAPRGDCEQLPHCFQVVTSTLSVHRAPHLVSQCGEVFTIRHVLDIQ
jgi:hypothetical protein